MTDETLESYIDAVNKGTLKDQIFLRPLSETVDIARVWGELPRGRNSSESSYHMYFIKNQQRVYVAAVLDMGCQDLHVFVKEEHRKQGHLRRALQEWIFPHLFSDGRPYQQVTYKERRAMQHALHVGFTRIEKGKAAISKDKIRTVSVLELKGQNSSVTEEEYREMRRKVNQAAGLLRMVQDQLEMVYDESGEFDRLIDHVTDMLFDVEDIYLGRYSQE